MANIIEQLLQLSQKAGNSLSSGSVSAEGILQQLGMLPAQENVMQPQARQAISQSGGASQMKQQAQQAPQGLDNPMAIAFAKKAEAELGKRAGQAAAEMPSDQLAEVVKTHGMVNDRIKNPDFKLRNGSTETMDMTANDGSNVLQGLLGGLRNFIASGGNVNEQGVAEPLRLLGGLLQENPSMTLQRQQAFALTPQGEKMKAEANLPSQLKIQEAKLIQEQMKTMAKMGKEGNLKPEHLLTSWTKIAEPWRETQASFNQMQSALTNPKTGKLDFSGTFNPAGDLDLIYGTAKTLDRGGRVTDGDTAIQEGVSGAYGDNLQKIYQKFKRRGKLTPEERKAMYIAANTRYKSNKNLVESTARQYETLAKNNGIDASKIITYEGFSGPNPTNTLSDTDRQAAIAVAKSRGLMK